MMSANSVKARLATTLMLSLLLAISGVPVPALAEESSVVDAIVEDVAVSDDEQADVEAEPPVIEDEESLSVETDDAASQNVDNFPTDDIILEVQGSADSYIANGTIGTCSWSINSAGAFVLTGPGSFEITDDWDTDQWRQIIGDYAEQITSIKVVGKVAVKGNASSMFEGLTQLTSVSLASLDVSGVTNMDYLFSGCVSLKSLDLSSWNTSQVTSMEGMFFGCESLVSLDLSAWSTTRVTNMASMFGCCYALTSLNLEGLVTSSATTLGGMFAECSHLSSLNMTGWNTSGAVYMGSMFEDCSALSALDVGNWSVGKVVDISHMFKDCSSLKSLDLHNWNTARVSDMGHLFQGCTSLGTINLKGWNTSSAQIMEYMFSGCSKLTSLEISAWNVAEVRDADGMFNACAKLSSLSLSGWNLNAASMTSMFERCIALKTLDLSNFSAQKAVSTANMFKNCEVLTSLNLRGLDTTTAVDLSDMFENCYELTRVDLGSKFSFKGEGDSGCDLYTQLPGRPYTWMSTKTGKDFMPDEVPSLTEDTYLLKWDKVRGQISLDVIKANVIVTHNESASISVPTNVEAQISEGMTPITYANASSDTVAKTFVVDSQSAAITIPKGTRVGTYEVSIRATSSENDTFESASTIASFNISIKYANTIKVSTKRDTRTVTYNPSKATVSSSNFIVTDAQGAVTYTNVSGNSTAKTFTVDRTSGDVTLPKGTTSKSDGYEVKIKVAAASTDTYRSWSKTFTYKIVVNKAANTMTAKVKAEKVTATYNASKAVVTASNITISNKKGTVTYSNASTSTMGKTFTVNKTTGEVTVPKATGAKTYEVKVKATVSGTTNYKSKSVTVTYKIQVKKAANPMVVKAVNKTVSYTTLTSKSVVLSPLQVTKAQGTVTYAKTSGSSYLTVNSTTGKVTAKKGTNKGTYTAKISVSAAGSTNYLSKKQTVTVKVTVS